MDDIGFATLRFWMPWASTAITRPADSILLRLAIAEAFWTNRWSVLVHGVSPRLSAACGQVVELDTDVSPLLHQASYCVVLRSSLSMSNALRVQMARASSTRWERSRPSRPPADEHKIGFSFHLRRVDWYIRGKIRGFVIIYGTDGFARLEVFPCTSSTGCPQVCHFL